ALRISRTVFSALSGMRLLACLIVAPQRGYDEPAILSYAISSFCPTSADGLQGRLSTIMRAIVAGLPAVAFSAGGDGGPPERRPGGTEPSVNQHCPYHTSQCPHLSRRSRISLTRSLLLHLF